MGDVGSLSLGGALGTLAVLTKNEFTLVILGGVFVAETLSVMLAGRLVQADRQATVQDGPTTPPLRAPWAGPSPRSSSGFWIICHHAGAAGAGDAEGALVAAASDGAWQVAVLPSWGWGKVASR